MSSPRGKLLGIWLTEPEHCEVRIAAANQGINMTSFCRELVLKAARKVNQKKEEEILNKNRTKNK